MKLSAGLCPFLVIILIPEPGTPRPNIQSGTWTQASLLKNFEEHPNGQLPVSGLQDSHPIEPYWSTSMFNLWIARLLVMCTCPGLVVR